MRRFFMGTSSRIALDIAATPLTFEQERGAVTRMYIKLVQAGRIG